MKTVIITGCSSGIGQATAARLARSGEWTVYATARRPETLAELENAGCRTRALDVTDEASMVAAVDAVTAESGRIDALVNNAGYSQSGATETLDLDDVRRQFETNVYGLSRMTQLVLPGMRQQRAGRIIIMSSIFGLFATPGRGYYEATKHALEAIGDSLRLEVARFGIKVVIVEPSPILGAFVPTTVGDLGLAPGSAAGDDDPYGDFWERFVVWHGAYREVEHPKGRGRLSLRSGDVAAVIEKAITVPRPRIRYRIGIPVRLLRPQRVLFGERAWEKFITTFFPTP